MQRVFYLQAGFIALIAVLHLYLGEYHSYYYRISWWDIPVHILGGLWVALAGAWLGSLFGYRTGFSHCILIALVIGVGWEVYEYVLGVGGSAFMSYPVDTAKDLLDDGIGGIAAGYIVRSILSL